MYNQKMKGETTHKASMGYLNAGTEKGRKWVEQDPITWELVRQIWDKMLTGNYSVSDLKEEGDAMGITILRSGKREVPVESAYRYMLCNRYYAGYVKVTNKETSEVKWHQGKHLPMVTEDEFDRVQLMLQNRGYKHQKLIRPTAIEGILNEILLCGKCMSEVNGSKKPTKMMFEQKTRYTCSGCKHRFSSSQQEPCPKCGTPINEKTKVDMHRYYRCCKKYSSHSCAHIFKDGKATKSLPAESIEHYLDQQISRLYLSEKLFNVLKRQLYTLWQRNNEVLERQKDILKADLSKLDKERVKIKREGLGKLMNEVEQEDQEHMLDENRGEQESIKDKLSKLEEFEEEKYERAWQALQVLADAKSVFNSPILDLAPKRNLVLSMISHLKITDSKMEIEWKKPFDAVAKASIAKKGRPKSGTDSDGDKFNWLPDLDSNQEPSR
ncbi:recombinase family protein [Candidatus Peribacteria bacterium]|nr:MAG: recombinase family protein [Candidatus Peribacteria bacterium]